jgi:hypothetical protein
VFQEVLQAHPEFVKAYGAIAKHQQGVWAGQDLSGAFAVRACLVVLPVPSSGKWREEVWLQGTGKSWKALKKFPARLLRMADEIEKLNTNFFRIPDACTNPTWLSLCQLPTSLRSNAETLNRHETIISKAFRSPSESSRVVELLNFAKWTTGRDRVREVAKLLNAAALAMKCENKFDATHLIQARYRYRKPVAYHTERRNKRVKSS